MKRSRRSNSLFCYGFLSHFGFFSMTPSRIRLLIIAFSDDFWRLPAKSGFFKKLREVSKKHHKAIFCQVSGYHRDTGIVFSKEQLQHLTLARLWAFLLTFLINRRILYALQSLQFTQSINPEVFRQSVTSFVVFHKKLNLETKPIGGIRHLGVCQSPQKTNTTVNQSVYGEKYAPPLHQIRRS